MSVGLGSGRTYGLFCQTFAGATALTLRAHADAPTAPDLDVASGLAAYNDGQYEEANARLSRAIDRLGIPLLALYAARSNAKLGNWVKACDLYLLAERVSPKTATNVPQLQAQYEAQRERGELLARTPRLTIELEGEDLQHVELTLDAMPVPKASIGTHQFVDPGHHVIRAWRDAQIITGELDLLEKQRKTIRLHFPRRELTSALTQELPSISTVTEADTSDASGLARRGVAPQSFANSPTVSVEEPNALRPKRNSGPFYPSASRDAKSGTDPTLRAFGWTGVGLGGTCILVGTLSGVFAISARSDFQAKCDADRCPPALSDSVDHYNQLRHWSTAGFLAGGVFAAAGLALIVVDSHTRRTPTAAVKLGPTSASWVSVF
jgi:hypothetical protein